MILELDEAHSKVSDTYTLFSFLDLSIVVHQRSLPGSTT